MIGNDWDQVLEKYFNSDSYKCTMKEVEKEYENYECFPSKDLIFASLKDTTFSSVKVIILGQDPYHTKGMADGHAFSADVEKLPPSLSNIIKAVEIDYPTSEHKSGSLLSWADQGVLLLNTSLTVRSGQPMSHKHLGWDKLIIAVLEAVLAKGGVVVMMWGKPSEKLVSVVSRNEDNLYLTAPHPSPLSAYRGFFDCGHFAKCNEFLNKRKESVIDFST